MNRFFKSSSVGIFSLFAVWLSSGCFGVSVKDIVPWLQVVELSAIATYHGLQITEQSDDKDKD
ncbi:MAG: hypothetical protein F6J86_18030 [Symploca sp. SIO1B1]|nr:hypothetical protein [Symploca sp. SIO1C2]NER95708.1 hypothetical protein [Symploca sp. SIO1B1]